MTHLSKPMDDQSSSISTPPQFWVVGGEYRDTGFSELEGQAEALGPYADYETAFKEWERRSVEMKRHAHVRYTIVGRVAR